MMKTIFALILALTLASCTKTEKPDPFQNVTCAIGKVFSKAAVNAFVSSFECAKPELIQSDLDTVLVKAKLCSAPVGLFEANTVNPICSTIVNIATEIVFNEGIPARYECKGGAAKEKVSDFLITFCQKHL